MKHLTTLLAVGIALAGCSSTKFTSDKDDTVDFTKYSTYEYYGWQDNSDQILNQFDKERLETSFGNELAKRGMNYVESGGDAVISLFIVVDQKTSTTAYTSHYGGGPYGYGYGGWGWGMGHSTTSYNEYDYLVGTLVIDVFDAETKNLIWQGVATGTVDDNPQTREKNIPRVVAQIMRQYPIPASK